MGSEGVKVEGLPDYCRAYEYHPVLGIIVVNESGETKDVRDIDKTVLKKLAMRNGFVCFKKFKVLEGEDLKLFARIYGKLVVWPNKGEIVAVTPEDNPSTFVLSREGLPLHWDVMFPPPPLNELPDYGDYTATYQMFQCTAAPPKEAGGATSFVDGRKILSKLSEEKKEKFRNTIMEYTTKLSYFGGTRRYPLIMKHPETGDDIFRFQEPWTESKLQQVYVSSPGLSEDELNSLLKELLELCYAKDTYMEYYWESGDLLVSDNHYVLHGRTPTIDDSYPRCLLRVQAIEQH